MLKKLFSRLFKKKKKNDPIFEDIVNELTDPEYPFEFLSDGVFLEDTSSSELHQVFLNSGCICNFLGNYNITPDTVFSIEIISNLGGYPEYAKDDLLRRLSDFEFRNSSSLKLSINCYINEKGNEVIEYKILDIKVDTWLFLDPETGIIYGTNKEPVWNENKHVYVCDSSLTVISKEIALKLLRPGETLDKPVKL